MKPLITIIILFLATTGFGQNRDRRAELDIVGGAGEIGVSPDGKIWLATSSGYTYYTNNIDSNWHYGAPVFDPAQEKGFRSPHLERISFFNKDTAILTGYIYDKERKNTSGYYRTTDGGKSWKLLDYGGDSWIYTICTNKKGHAWMGGLHNELYYSNDFGQSWITLKMPYKASDRTYTIYMSDSQTGIASSSDNEILATADNWKTVRFIPTPFDQQKSQVEGLFNKTEIWGNYLVVNQGELTFYSDANLINWKPFPIKIIDFEVDVDSKKLFGITDSLKIFCFASLTDFQPLTDKRLSSYPAGRNTAGYEVQLNDIKIVDHSLYAKNNWNEIFKVNENSFKNTLPYTTDSKIPEPRIIKQGNELTWGAKRNHIYLTEGAEHNWYREKVLDFWVSDMKLLNDSTAILWDGIRNNYLYALKDHVSKIYYPENPLNDFLICPVKSFVINSGSSGCFHNESNEIKFERDIGSTFKTNSTSTHDNNPFSDHYQKAETTTLKNQVNGHLLSSALLAINSNPYTIPSLKDFQITKKDKKNYLALVEKRLNDNKPDYLDRKKKIDKAFYYSVPEMLDTLNNSVMAEVLNQQEGIWSTTSNWFTVQIVNLNNDTINISRKFYESALPWNLPWEFKYKGVHFNCYNIEFSKFIKTCLPKDFRNKEVFDNSQLIMAVADYLWNKEK